VTHPEEGTNISPETLVSYQELYRVINPEAFIQNFKILSAVLDVSIDVFNNLCLPIRIPKVL
jgi:hypothetical protein